MRSSKKLDNVWYSSSLGEWTDVLDALHHIDQQRDTAAAPQSHVFVLSAKAFEQVLEQDRDKARAGRVVAAFPRALRRERKLLDGVRGIRCDKLAHAIRGRNPLLHVENTVQAPEEAFVKRLFSHEARAARCLLSELRTLRMQPIQPHGILAVICNRVLCVLEMARHLRLYALRERRAVHTRRHGQRK